MLRQLFKGLFNIVSGRYPVYMNRAGRMVAGGKALPKGAFLNAVEISEGDFIRIVPVGKFPAHPDGPHEITFENVQEMADNFTNHGTDLLFDYEHHSLWGETKAAGWSAEVEARADGLYIKYPDFTKNALQQITDREYRYFSPVYYLEGTGKDGSNLGAVIDSVAVTNRPWMDREIDHIRNDNLPEESMKYSADYKKELGLAEDATDEQVEAKVNKLNEIAAEGTKLQEPTEKEPEAKNDSESESEKSDIEKTIETAVANAMKPISEKVDGLITGNKTEAAETLVNSAIADGKILPADKEVWLNSATGDFTSTKKKLDERKKNSAMPGKVKFNKDTESGEQAGVKRNSKQAHDDCLSFLKSEGRMPIAYRNSQQN